MYQIFVVEDELLIRQNIRNIIENMTGPYVFCGEASDGEMALSMMQDYMPDILLTDIKMPFLDGFGLIRHVKAMMPWLKIIIITGYGEFESAQRAIALGVDLYLLKPIRSADLAEAIRKIAQQIEDGKSQAELPPGYDRDELHTALHQHFMQQLLYGGADTAVLLERARALGLDVAHPFYQVVLFLFEEYDRRALQTAVNGLARSLEPPLYYYNESDQLTLLLTAQNREAVTEEAYRLVNITRHELKDACAVITTVVGNVAERLSAIRDACGAANAMLRKVHSVSAGQVIDVNDTAQITAEIVSFSSPFDEAFQQELLRAAPEEVPALLDGYLSGPGSEQFNSMLVRYYTLVDILKITVRIIARAKAPADPKDVAAEFSSEYDIFAASSSRDSFRELALELLQKAAQAKQESPGGPKHSHVVSRAEAYVAEHYCDPNISLISVARHVGMSSAHFSTIFSQIAGKTFISYLTGLRIERAKALLSDTDMRLSAIAMEIGYNEPNYFSHVFRKLEGITPKEYRARYQK